MEVAEIGHGSKTAAAYVSECYIMYTYVYTHTYIYTYTYVYTSAMNVEHIYIYTYTYVELLYFVFLGISNSRIALICIS